MENKRRNGQLTTFLDDCEYVVSVMHKVPLGDILDAVFYADTALESTALTELTFKLLLSAVLKHPKQKRRIETRDALHPAVSLTYAMHCAHFGAVMSCRRASAYSTPAGRSWR